MSTLSVPDKRQLTKPGIPGIPGILGIPGIPIPGIPGISRHLRFHMWMFLRPITSTNG